MLILDQIRKSDWHLRALAIGMLAGMLILLAGLWYVQVVSAGKYEEFLKSQSYRTVRVTAVRGKIFDRHGNVLAENRPRYNINLYLEDLRPLFLHEYTNHVKKEFIAANPDTKFTGKVRLELSAEARYRTVSNMAYRVTASLGQPGVLDPKRFSRHYNDWRYMPFPLVVNLSPAQVATFAERNTELPGIELEVQPVRAYPHGATAAQLLGYVKWYKPFEEESVTYKYVMPDFMGEMGVERAFDEAMRGHPGARAVLINNLSYRQRADVLWEPEAGRNVWLTLDLDLQKTAEQALAAAMANVRGAAVVMDVRNGDVLALVSLPSFDPNRFIDGVNTEEWKHLNDEHYKPMFSRATFGAYHPGSTFKMITALALLETGVDPLEPVYTPGYFANQKLIGRRTINDLAAPGDYDLVKAIKHSSNTYFIQQALKAGLLKKLLETGHRFHLGERTDLPTGNEARGSFPHYEDVARRWSLGNLANVCIGQEITVTPLQMAVVTSAIANGGRVYWPRIVSRIEHPDGESGEKIVYPAGRLRGDARIQPQHLEFIHRGMRAVVEDSGGTATAARLNGFHIAGKTGTAERGKTDQTTWFVSFGPYEDPRYAVVVMIESGGSGGGTCGPVARKIFEAIQRREARGDFLSDGGGRTDEDQGGQAHGRRAVRAASDGAPVGAEDEDAGPGRWVPPGVPTAALLNSGAAITVN